MSAEYKELIAFRNALQEIRDDMPKIMDKLVVGEGVYAAGQAKKIATDQKVVNLGEYRRSFHADEKAQRSGDWYRISFFNNADYAKHLEYGFRSHFVPGHWEGKTFVYNPGDPEGGMYVGPRGGYVNGHFVFRLAVRRTKDTKDARLKRKLNKELRDRLKKKGVL